MNRLVVATLSAAGLLLTACSQAGDSSAGGSAEPDQPASCTKQDLKTLTSGRLVIATGQPAYPPWVEDDKPESGKGFEAAVAYAVANQLGFAKDDVSWARSTFDGAIAPGPKDFDWNIQQFTITPDRQKAVDFSSAYYDAPQAVVTSKGSPVEKAKTLDELKGAKLGAAVGSTSLDAAQQVIAPTQDVMVFNDNAAAVSALKNGQIDGIVVDLPTGFYLIDQEIDSGVMVGQLPAAEGQPLDQYGILLAKGSPLTACTSQAVDALREDGTLDSLIKEWLPDSTARTLS